MKYKDTLWRIEEEDLEDHSKKPSEEGWVIFQVMHPQMFNFGRGCYIIWQKSEPKQRATPRKFTPPTIEEIEAFIKERGYDIDARKFFQYYAKADWTDSQGNKVKNWKSKMIHNWVHDGAIAPKEDYTKPKTY
jgi:hypothetical protein